MIHFKRGFDPSPFQRMTIPELRGQLAILRSSPGREEMIVQLQESYWQNMGLTWVDEHNFDQHYIDDVDVVIDELNERTKPAQGRG